VERLLKYRFFDDELPDTRPEQQESVVAVCECGSVAQINKSCWSCYDQRNNTDWRDRLIELAGEHGLDRAVDSLHKKYPALEIRSGYVIQKRDLASTQPGRAT